ncbi:hypothetical protein [Haloarcula sp. CGMCC 1.2071]|uniref:hypothetical protein n=1 Tax=Haloarcula sp. CGMCC 1.2071 TaxID=3111454 RepID=UPI00300EAD87
MRFRTIARIAEALSVALALDADGASRLTYTDEQETVRVLSLYLWFDAEPLGVAGVLRRTPDGWEVESLGRCSHASFLDAVDRAAEEVDGEGRSSELVAHRDGEVEDRRPRDLD